MAVGRLRRSGALVETRWRSGVCEGTGRGLGESVSSERHYEMTVIVIILALIVVAGVVTARQPMKTNVEASVPSMKTRGGDHLLPYFTYSEHDNSGVSRFGFVHSTGRVLSICTGVLATPRFCPIFHQDIRSRRANRHARPRRLIQHLHWMVGAEISTPHFLEGQGNAENARLRDASFDHQSAPLLSKLAKSGSGRC